jgi:hypothetical protein
VKWLALLLLRTVLFVLILRGGYELITDVSTAWAAGPDKVRPAHLSPVCAICGPPGAQGPDADGKYPEAKPDPFPPNVQHQGRSYSRQFGTQIIQAAWTCPATWKLYYAGPEGPDDPGHYVCVGPR